MSAPSDRERLLKLIDGSAAVSSMPLPPPMEPSSVRPDPATPLSRPKVPFQIKEQAAQVYDRVRAAVVSSEKDKQFSMATATVILVLVISIASGVDRWRTWRATRDVAVVSEDKAVSIKDELGFKLVGVDWSEIPVALVEDLSTGKTNFLRQGDSIKGARVQLIFKDKVIFNTPKGRIALR